MANTDGSNGSNDGLDGVFGIPAVAGASIRVVAKRTGIPADTLRMWERRYGFPSPPRRVGGSRVYSEQDVARLRLIGQALAAGFRPSEAVPLPMDELARLVAASAHDLGSNAVPARTEDNVSFGAEAVINALVADDVARVRSLLRSAAITLGPRSFVTALAHPLTIRVGELWQQGSLDVRHEHLVTACLSAQLHVLLAAMEDGSRAPTVLLATLPGEDHLLALDMIAVYLAAALAAPRLLGTHAPPAEIAQTARALRADVVGVSISAAADPKNAAEQLAALASLLPKDKPLWVGGAGARAVAPEAAPDARIVSSFADLDVALEASRTTMRVR